MLSEYQEASNLKIKHLDSGKQVFKRRLELKRSGYIFIGLLKEEKGKKET